MIRLVGFVDRAGREERRRLMESKIGGGHNTTTGGPIRYGIPFYSLGLPRLGARTTGFFWMAGFGFGDSNGID